jgi:(p)ppGpp synthase/HD superfamily hydrolase
MTGYSDRINHALAFAAKHHDQQVRKGTRLPYITHPANVAIILTRYDRPDETVIAGILHDVVEDCVRDGYTRDALEMRIGEKFGAEVLRMVLAVTKRRVGDDGVELSGDEQRADYLARLAGAPAEALWVCAADKLHNAATVLADLARTEFPEAVWSRFGPGREGTIRWHRRVLDRLRELGFDASIVDELRETVERLEAHAGPESTRTDARTPRGGASAAREP